MPSIRLKLDRRYGHLRIYRFFWEVLDRFKSDQVPQVGAQLAYYLLFSLFPLMIAVLTILSYTPLAQETALASILDAMPDEAADLISPIIRDIVSARSSALLSTSLILALWSGSTGLNNVLLAMNKSFDTERQRPFVLQRLLALGATVALILVIIFSLLGQVFGQKIIDLLASRFSTHLKFWLELGNILRIAAPLLLMIFFFTLLYKFGPAFKKGQRLAFCPALLGGCFTTLGWSLMSLGFNFYVNHFSNYSNTYGSLGGVIIMMTWLFLGSIILLLGAVVAASWVATQKPKATTQNPKPSTPKQVLEAGLTAPEALQAEAETSPLRSEDAHLSQSSQLLSSSSTAAQKRQRERLARLAHRSQTPL